MPVDKNSLYGRFLQSTARQQRLVDAATRKALDLPLDEEMNITTHHSGLELRHLLGLAAVLLCGGVLGGGGLWSLSTLLRERAPHVPAAAPPAAPQDFRVSFWTDEGAEIPLAPEKQ